jgi:hypothetical protein
MLYPELFHDFEQVRWSLSDDVPWDRSTSPVRRQAQ